MAKKSKSTSNVIYDAPAVSPAMMRNYQAEDDLRTLQRAGEVQADKSRVSAAKKLAAKQAAALHKICK